jgi:CelD/BcsL family acetyltransferase involved in cellulose biosynthesis
MTGGMRGVIKLPTSQPRASIATSVAPVVGVRPTGIRFELVDGLDALREEWDELAHEGQSIFSTWEFANTWWEQFGGGRRLLAVACFDGGGLFAILPLYLWRRRPLRVIRLLGHGCGDILGPICRPERRADAGRALRRLLEVASWDWDVFVAENLPADHGWARCLGGTVIRREGNPVLRIRGGFEQYLAGRTPNFRHQARARERRLARHHHVEYRLSTNPARLDDDLTTLFRLHARRFDGDSAFGGPRVAFHRRFAHQALERGWLRLWILELDGRPAAAEYGFRFGGAECFYQLGRDPSFARESLGTTMLTHAIRAGVEDGVREFGFLRGHEQYKYRFATEDGGLESLCVVRGPAAAAALAVVQAVKASPTARRALRGPLDM